MAIDLDSYVAQHGGSGVDLDSYVAQHSDGAPADLGNQITRAANPDFDKLSPREQAHQGLIYSNFGKNPFFNKPEGNDFQKSALSELNAPETSLGSKVQTFAEKALNTFPFFGHLPHAEAKVQSLYRPEGFQQLKDAQLQRFKQMDTDNPGTSEFGNTAPWLALGELAPAAKFLQASPEASATAKIASGLMRNGLISGTAGFLQNPGDTPGQSSGLQLLDRTKNALKMGTVGAGIGGLAEGYANAPQLGEELSTKGQMKAVDAGHGSLRDYKAISKDPMTFETKQASMGDSVLRNNVLGNGTDLVKPMEVAKNAKVARMASGERFGQMLDDLNDAIAKKTGNAPGSQDLTVPGSTPPKAGIDLNAVADHLEENFQPKSKFSGGTNTRAQVKSLADTIRNDAESYGGPINVKEAQAYKMDVDKEANWNKVGDATPEEKMYRKLSMSLSKGIEDAGEGALKYLGADIDPQFVSKFRQEKTDYGNLSKFEDAAFNGALRFAKNRSMSPSDYMAAVEGLLTGVATGRPLTGVAMGGGAAIANKVGRVYGSQTTAKALNSAGGLLKNVNPTNVQDLSGIRPGLLAPLFFNQNKEP